MDENFFVSGSIDGKIRIWGVKKQRVVDWADIRDVITAISYRPDGKVRIMSSLKMNVYVLTVSMSSHICHMLCSDHAFFFYLSRDLLLVLLLALVASMKHQVQTVVYPS